MASPKSKPATATRILPIMQLALMALIGFRYLVALDNGATPLLIVRTYAYWALMLAPVAYLADVLLRTIANYRLVRVAVDRTRQR